MRLRNHTLVINALTCSMLVIAASRQVVADVMLGQKDDFEDGTVQGWRMGLDLPGATENIPSGGPAGADDNFLQINSFGDSGAGGKLVALQGFPFTETRWTGNYLSAGVDLISMDLINMGPFNLSIRLGLSGNPFSQSSFLLTPAVSLPINTGWQSVSFSLAPADLLAVNADADTILSDVSHLRILNNPAPEFIGVEIETSLGVDNITAPQAQQDPVMTPEPSSVSIWAIALLVFAGYGWYRHRTVSVNASRCPARN